MFYGTYQPGVGEGTRVHWRWEVGKRKIDSPGYYCP